MDGYQFSSGQSAYSHPNMAYPGSYMQPQFNAGFNTNTHYDPSTPSFQPNGMDVQRYQTPETAATPDMQEMQKYIVDMNVSHINDKMRLEHSVRDNAKALSDLRSAVMRDLRTLESRIKSLQDEDADTDDGVFNEKTKAAMNALSALDKKLSGNDADLLRIDLTPSKEMLEHYSLPKIAEEYLTRADIMGRVVSELRRQANKINGVDEEQDAGSGKLLEAQPTPGSKVIGFACCETAYGDVKELLMHVKEAHSDTIQPKLASDAGSQSTPTHTPAPRPRSSRSRAVEIKAPLSKLDAETGEILARLTEKIGRTHGAGEKAAAVAPVEAQSSVQPEVPDQVQTAGQAQVPDQPQAMTQSRAALQPQTSTKWVPFAITQMKVREANIPDNAPTFSWDFIHQWFGGEEWSSGFYFNSEAGKEDPPEGMAYWLLDSEHEPYLPEAPGKNGAKLTPFLNDTLTLPGEAPYEWHYDKCPVFIKEKRSTEYKYYGTYSQTRYSDKVDYDHLMTQIPDHVRRYWAQQLSNSGRPDWVTEKLMDQFWQRPKYEGPSPTDSACQTPATFATGEDSAGGIERRVTKALEAYAKELKDWERDSRIKVGLLSEQNIYDSFAKSDLDIEPGMRLWWEYFEFKKFDTKLLDNLTRLSKNPNTSKASGKAGAKRPATPPIRGTGSTDLKAGALDEKEERKLKDFMPKARPATPPVRGTHETAGTIDTSAAQIVKPSPKTGDDVAAAVATLQKEATKKQAAAVDSKARKAALEQKQRDAARAPTQPSYLNFNNDAPKTASRASAVPKEGLSGLGTWLPDEKKPEADKKGKETVKPAQPGNEANKPMPTWGGGGDLDVAKRLNDEMRKAAPAPGKGNAPKKAKASPPHLRKK